VTLRISNTLTGRKEEFVPIGDPVRMYVCGMTPKYHPHVGHARLFVATDVMRRTLEFAGYRVQHVQNFTDIDDKIIARANEEGVSAQQVAQEYSEGYFDVMDRIGVKRAHVYPSVTGFMPQIIAFVEGLVESGYAYSVDGDVYFEVARFPEYGKLSGRTDEGDLVGVRKELEPGKRDPRDFALWKRAKPGEPSWESPWGPGRPGWHIECSTMVRETLGDQIDLHSGGQDLIFPHHENEIAQSEALTHHAPFARYWPHVGWVMTGTEKMSHSLMNFTTVRDVLDHYEPAALRIALMQVHYRAPMAFSEESLIDATRSLRRLQLAYGDEPPPRDATAEVAADLLDRFTQLLQDDFNTPGALGVMYDTAREVNRREGAGDEGAALRLAFRTMVDTLGIPMTPADRTAPLTDAAPFIDLLIEVRGALRNDKQWAASDRIRDGLKRLGVLLEDSPTGTSWRFEERGEQEPR
jgi:cysteinyl-tRNA synthetase